MVFRKSTIQLLRFHFSFFLLPVYLFALSQLENIDWTNAIVVFAILHLLVYPSSNGYNSYMDKDETPIGGLKNPLQPTKQLLYTTAVMDIIAIVLSIFVNIVFALCILLYILASRAYSYRRIRLKKYPFTGFLTVFIFQGALIFFATYYALHPVKISIIPFLPCIISSLLIGALYPLTQVYQHEEDKKDGVISISCYLGKRGTFIFSMLLFFSATFLLYLRFNQQDELNHFYWYLFIMLPVVLFFLYWMARVWRNEEAADFRNSLLMNVLSTLCTTVFFIMLIVIKL
jgi:1,4-dihydroxy-2-naphthoate octaprenyltransferase